MEQIKVTILGKDISLACESNEKEKLIAAVKQIDDLMGQIKAANANMNTEKVALIACIQLSSQLLTVESSGGPFKGVAYGDYKSKMDTINTLLDTGISSLK